jgi:hypothetical protein
MSGQIKQMNGIDFTSCSNDSRIWVFVSNRELDVEDQTKIETSLLQFAASWTAHNNQLKATAWIECNRFIFLMVDESKAGASGCSIDKSVQFVNELGKEFGIDFFERLIFYYINALGNIAAVHKNDLKVAFENGMINENTLFYNVLIQRLSEYHERWLVPFAYSWQFKMM